MSTFGALLAGHRDEHHDGFLAAMDVDRVVELLSFLGSWKQQSEPDVKENSYHIEVGFFMIEVQNRGRPREPWPD